MRHDADFFVSAGELVNAGLLQRDDLGRIGPGASGDLVIDGRTPTSPPFLTAKEIEISMRWNTLVDRRVVFDSTARLPLESKLVQTATKIPTIVICWRPTEGSWALPSNARRSQRCTR